MNAGARYLIWSSMLISAARFREDARGENRCRWRSRAALRAWRASRCGIAASVAMRKAMSAGLLNGVMPPSMNRYFFPARSISSGGK